jgi:midasin
LAGLLESERGSITVLEQGGGDAVPRHPNFRLFAAMNPATDAGATHVLSAKQDISP